MDKPNDNNQIQTPDLNNEDYFSDLIDGVIKGDDVRNRGINEDENKMIDASYKIKSFYEKQKALESEKQNSVDEKFRKLDKVEKQDESINQNKSSDSTNPKEEKINPFKKFMLSLKAMPIGYKLGGYFVMLLILLLGSYAIFSLVNKDEMKVAKDGVEVKGIELVKTAQSIYGVKTNEGDIEIRFEEGIKRDQDLAKLVLIEPITEADLEIASDGLSIKVNPKKDLEMGKVYKVTLNSGVELLNGKVIASEQEWSFRTEPNFSITGVTPKDETKFVPTNTAIEFEFNYSNISAEKFAEFVSFEPSIEGKFELRGRKIVFLPKELYPQSTYKVFVKKGFANEFGYTIQEDKEFFFTTTYPDQENSIYKNAARFELYHIPLVGSFISNPALFARIYNIGINDMKASVYEINEEGVKEFIKYSDSNIDYTKKPKDEYLKKIADTGFVKNAGDSSRADLNYKFEKGVFLVEFYSEKVPYKKYKLLSITDYDMIVEKGMDKTNLWAYDFSNLKFKPEVSVEVFTKSDNDLKSIHSGKTDSKGYLSYPTISGNPDLIVAKAGDKVFYLADIPINNYLYFDSYHYSTNQEYKSYIYTDRPIYRRGDKVNFKFLTRKDKDFSFSVPKDKEVVIKALNYDGKEIVIFEKNYKLDEWGTISDSFSIPKNFNGYGVTITAKFNNESYTYQTSVPVGEYEKSLYDISIDVDKSAVLDGEKVNATISVKDIVDKPYIGSVKLNLYMGEFMQPNDSYSYDKDLKIDSPYGQMKLEEKTINLDENGVGTIELTPNIMSYGKSIKAQAYQYVLEAVVGDDKGFTQTERAGVIVWETDKRLSVKPEKQEMMYGTTGKEVIYKVKLTNSITNEIIKDKDISAKLWVEWYEQVETGSYYDPNTKSTVKQYRSDRKVEDISSTIINSGSDGETEFKFTPKKGGSYNLKLEIEGLDAEFYLGYYRDAKNQDPAFQMDGKEMIYDSGITLTLPSETYRIGEQVDAKIESNLTAEALMLIKRGEVYEWKIIDLSKPSSISYVVQQRDYPSILFEVLFPSAGFSTQDQSNIKEMFESATSSITVQDDTKEMKVDVSGLKSEYSPSEKASLQYNVYDSKGNKVDAELSVAVVDEAILANYTDNSEEILANYKSSVNQRTRRIYNRVDKDVMQEGGYGDGGGGTRRDLKDTAYWNGKLAANGGSASSEFKLADNLTGWAVIVVAVTKDGRVGRTVLNTKTVKDVFVNYEVPQFLRYGDNLNLNGRVYNYTAKSESGKLESKAEGCKVDKQSIDLSVAEKSATNFSFNIVPDSRSENCKINISFKKGETLIDGLEKNIPIKPEGYYKLESIKKYINKEGEIAFKIDQKTDLNRVVLSLKRDIINKNDLGFSYPEVNSGWDIGASLMYNLVLWEEWDKLGIDLDKGDLKNLIEFQIRSLSSLQDKEGGISYFGYDANDVELSAIIGYIISRVEKSGFEVSSDFKQMLGAYLLGNLYNPELNDEEKVLILKGLQGLLPQETLAGSSYLYSNRKELLKTPYAIAILGNVMYEAGNVSEAQILAKELLGFATVGENFIFFDDKEVVYKDLKTKEFIASEALMLLSRFEEYNTERVKITNWLSENSNFAEITAERKLIEANLIKYRLINESVDSVVRVELNGAEIWNGELKDMHSLEIKDYIEGDNKLVIKGGSSLYADLEISKLVRSMDSNNGFVVKTDYLDLLSGKPVNELKRGQFIRIRTTVNSNIDASRLIVRNSLPAGVKSLDYYYDSLTSSISYEVLDNWFRDQASNKTSMNMIEFNDFNYYEVKKGKSYTFDTLGIALFSGKFNTGANQAYLESFTDIGGLEAGRVITVGE